MFWLVQSLRFTYIDSDFSFDSKFVNLTPGIDNQTHIGEATLKILQNIPNYVVNIIASSEKGKTIMNTTMKPCERSMQQKFYTFMLAAFRSDSVTVDSNTTICPLAEVSELNNDENQFE